MPLLYLACRGEIDDRRLFWATFDGRGASPEFSSANMLSDRASQNAPALAVFQDKLYMAMRGPLDDQTLFWATLELRKNEPTWSAAHPLADRGSFSNPGLAPFLGKLYMAWRGIETDHRLFWATFDGISPWSPPQILDDRASSAGPALAVFQDKLYMAFRGPTDDQRLFWATFDGTSPWSPPLAIEDMGSKDGPSLTVFKNKLHLFCRGDDGDQRLFFTTFDGLGTSPRWSVKSVLNGVFSSWRPAAAVFRNQLLLLHIGTIGQAVNVHGDPGVAGSDPGSPDNTSAAAILDVSVRYTSFDGRDPVLPENFAFVDSATSPALAVFPEVTRSLRAFLVSHGFDPGQGALQVGSGSLSELMGLR